MTTDSDQSNPENAGAQPAWRVHDEGRVGTVCYRVFWDGDISCEAVFANTPEGLDSPHALRVGPFMDLRGAMAAAAWAMELSWSRSMSEERMANRTLAQVNAIGLHRDPHEFPWRLRSAAQFTPLDTDPENPDLIVQDFRCDGLFGRVRGKRTEDRGFFDLILANDKMTLDDRTALRIGDFDRLYRAMTAGRIVIDIAAAASHKDARSAYRDLAWLGVRLLHKDDKLGFDV